MSSSLRAPALRRDPEVELRRVTHDALGVASLAVASMFGLFVALMLLGLNDQGRVGVAADVGVLAAAALAHVALRRRWMPVEWTFRVAALLGLLVAANLFVSFWGTTGGYLTVNLSVVIIGVGAFILSTRWAVATIAPILAVWAMAADWPTEAILVQRSLMLVATTVVAMGIHVARIRSHRHLARLRQDDRAQRDALESALASARDMQRELDHRVTQRTAELSEALRSYEREIEERRRVERERQTLAGHLEHAQRVDSIGRLAGGVAHDFNNLLTVILGNLERVLERDDLDDLDAGLLEPLSVAHQASGRAAEITSKLLAYSRRQPLTREPLYVGEVVQGVRSMLQRICGENVTLDIQLADERGPAFGDVVQIEQTLVNLVLNAVDAMDGRGKLTIGVGPAARGRDFARDHRAATRDAYTRLAVADTGQGIDAAVLPKVFEPFFTTKTRDKGTGLGLAMVQGVVAQHGGFMGVDSTPGEGTRFEVFLPCDPGAVMCVKKPDPAPTLSDVALDGVTVLVAEDDLEVRELIESYLAGFGCEVLTARNGDEALGVADRHDGTLDLLVTDMMMPGMAGDELATTLRARRADLAVLFISGYAFDEHLDRAQRLEGTRHVRKPFSADDLRRAVAELMASSSPSSPA